MACYTFSCRWAFSSVREGTLTFGHLGDMETNDILDCFIFSLRFQLFVKNDVLKVRYIRKADWRAVDFSKNQTNKFDLFALKSKKANKTNLSVICPFVFMRIYGNPICFRN